MVGSVRVGVKLDGILHVMYMINKKILEHWDSPGGWLPFFTQLQKDRLLGMCVKLVCQNHLNMSFLVNWRPFKPQVEFMISANFQVIVQLLLLVG